MARYEMVCGVWGQGGGPGDAKHSSGSRLRQDRRRPAFFDVAQQVPDMNQCRI